MKLLIVEDDRLLSNALARSLRDAYAVDQAFDGEEGLLSAAPDAYALALLDVMLPDPHGFSVPAALLPPCLAPPVLTLTAPPPTTATPPAPPPPPGGGAPSRGGPRGIPCACMNSLRFCHR